MRPRSFLKKAVIIVLSGGFFCAFSGLFFGTRSYGQAPAGYASGVDSNSVLVSSGQCANTAKASSSALEAGADDPDQCSHSRLLREGDNVYQIYAVYHRVRESLVLKQLDPNAGGSPGNFQAMVDQRVCAPSDGGATNCLARLHRQTIDAGVRARQQLLKQNAARSELLTEGGGGQGGGSSAGPTVFKDLDYDAAVDKSGNMIHMQKPQDLLNGAQGVSFGSAVKDAQTQGLADSTQENEATKNANADAGDASLSNFDMASPGTLSGSDPLAKQVKAVSSQFAASASGDAKALSEEGQRNAPGSGSPDPFLKSTVNVNNSIDALAFRTALKEVRDAALQKQRKPAKNDTAENADLSAVDNENLTTSIHTTGDKNGTVDQWATWEACQAAPPPGGCGPPPDQAAQSQGGAASGGVTGTGRH